MPKMIILAAALTLIAPAGMISVACAGHNSCSPYARRVPPFQRSYSSYSRSYPAYSRSYSAYGHSYSPYGHSSSAYSPHRSYPYTSNYYSYPRRNFGISIGRGYLPYGLGRSYIYQRPYGYGRSIYGGYYQYRY